MSEASFEYEDQKENRYPLLIKLNKRKKSYLNITNKIFEKFITDSKWQPPTTNTNTINFNDYDKTSSNSYKNKIYLPKYKNIHHEMKKIQTEFRSYFDINSSPYKEMRTKFNSLTFLNFKKGFQHYFFGPNGIVTNQCKALRDYYFKKGLRDKIYAGLINHYNEYNFDSYQQRVINAKDKILKLSRHYAFADNKGEELDTKAIYNNKLVNQKKNFVYLNKKKLKQYAKLPKNIEDIVEKYKHEKKLSSLDVEKIKKHRKNYFMNRNKSDNIKNFKNSYYNSINENSKRINYDKKLNELDLPVNIRQKHFSPVNKTNVNILKKGNITMYRTKKTLSNNNQDKDQNYIKAAFKLSEKSKSKNFSRESTSITNNNFNNMINNNYNGFITAIFGPQRALPKINNLTTYNYPKTKRKIKLNKV